MQKLSFEASIITQEQCQDKGRDACDTGAWQVFIWEPLRWLILACSFNGAPKAAYNYLEHVKAGGFFCFGLFFFNYFLIFFYFIFYCLKMLIFSLCHVSTIGTWDWWFVFGKHQRSLEKIKSKPQTTNPTKIISRFRKKVLKATPSFFFCNS